jgi:SAM-dependent methyltransferase
MGEWNADVYHRVSNPQTEWGRSVLARLPLQGHELVLDVGCGTGRLTADLLARLSRGKVVRVDLSSNMLGTARANLRPKRGEQPRKHCETDSRVDGHTDGIGMIHAGRPNIDNPGECCAAPRRGSIIDQPQVTGFAVLPTTGCS